MLPWLKEGAALERFRPETAADGPGEAPQRRAPLASTLLAGLELGREGAAPLSQGEAFGEIVVAPAGRPDSAHADPQAEVAPDPTPPAILTSVARGVRDHPALCSCPDGQRPAPRPSL